VNIGFEWVVLGGALICALIVFGKMQDFAGSMSSGINSLSDIFGGGGSGYGTGNMLQSGAYVIGFGLLISLISLIVASLMTDEPVLGEFSPTHKVKLLTESVGLGLRKIPSSSEETFIKIPNGTEIQYISLGDEVNLDINDTTQIKGFWYKIRTKDNVKGWCFSGSLEKI
jgi:hypothetical protein